MKKLIHTSLITLAIISMTGNANASVETNAATQSKLSFACKAMLQRGSQMFCGDALNSEIHAKKAAISELAQVSNSSYACNTMNARGSGMFCQKEKAVADSYISNH